MKRFYFILAAMVAMVLGFASCTKEDVPEVVTGGSLVFSTRGTMSGEMGGELKPVEAKGVLGPDNKVRVYEVTLDEECKTPADGFSARYVQLPPEVDDTYTITIYGNWNPLFSVYEWHKVTWVKSVHNGGSIN